MYTPEEIAETYKKMDDSELIKFASNQARKLRKDVVKELKKEITSRGLDTSLLSWIDAEVHDFTGLERDSLLSKIKGVSCPKCNANNDLNAFEFNRITSYIITSSQKKYTQVLCNSCGKREKWTTIGSNFLLGWWSRRGIFITPFLLIQDLVNFFFIQRKSGRILEEFIDVNTGYFRRNETEESSIIIVLKSHNFIQKKSGNT